MEPIRGEYNKQDVDMLDAWIYFERIDTSEDVKGVLDWFANRGFVIGARRAVYPYDHWYENEGEVETFESEQELLDYVDKFGCNNYHIDLHGHTEEGNRLFSIDIYGNQAFLTLFDYRIEWVPEEDDTYCTHHELPFYPDCSLHKSS